MASDQKTIELVAANKKAEFERVLTRLAGPDMRSEDRVVFDKVGDTYRLAEMWIAGHDGPALLHEAAARAPQGPSPPKGR